VAKKESIIEAAATASLDSGQVPSLIQGQIAYLYKNKTLGFWSNILLSSFLAFFLWFHFANQQFPLLIWLGLIITLSIVRLIMGRSFKPEHQYTQVELTSWANRHVFFSTFISTIWGLAGVVFFPAEFPYLIMMILVLFSVLLASIPTLAASRIAYYFQILITLLPITILLFLSKDDGHSLVAGAVIILAITLIFASNYIYQLLYELQETQLKLQDLADTDQLTQLANRRHFDRKFKLEWRRAMREKTPISMLLIDVDFFKKYNDTYGHQAGDSCLKQIADTLASVTHRPADLASRYGGEEFSILLPVTKQTDAVMLAERLRRKIEGLQIEHSRTDIGVVTVSIGVSCCEPAWDFTGKTPDEEQKVIFPAMLLTAADNALYVSKERGRNQVSEQGCGDHKMAKALRKQAEADTSVS